MSIIPKLLKSRQKFPKPEMNLDFNIESKIQEGATSVDVAGWTGETLKEGLATVDVTQATAAAQSVWMQGYDPDGPTLVTNGDFSGGTAGWTIGPDPIVSVTSEELTIDRNGAAGKNVFYQEMATIASQRYQVSFDIISHDSGTSKIRTTNATRNGPNITNLDIMTLGTATVEFIATSAVTFIHIEPSGVNTATGVYDNVTVNEAIENNKKSRITSDGGDYQEDMPTQAGDFTFFIKFDTKEPADQVLMGSSVDDDQLFFVDATGSLKFRTSLAVDREYAGADFTDGTTRVVALTRLGDDFELYIDGSPVLSVTDAGDILLDWLGSRMTAGIGFEGNMYKALIYPEALTADEVVLKSASLA